MLQRTNHETLIYKNQLLSPTNLFHWWLSCVNYSVLKTNAAHMCAARFAVPVIGTSDLFLSPALCSPYVITRCPPRHGHSLMLLTVTLCCFLLKCRSWSVGHLTGVFSRSEINYFKVLIFTYNTDTKMVYRDSWRHSDLGCYSNVHRKSKILRVLS